MSVEVVPYAPTSVLETLPCSLPVANIAEDVDIDELAERFVQSLHRLSSSDLVKDAVWRDLFALSGTTRTFYSPQSVANAWSETCLNRKAQGFVFVLGSGRLVRLSEGVAWAEVMFNFRCEGTPSTICSGFLNLIPDLNRLWRIWMIRTILEQLEGCRNVDKLHPEGSVTQQVNGISVHAETAKPQINASTPDGTVQADAVTNFDVIIIGAGQAGLGTAGRLQALGVHYVVLDKHAQIGENWLTRYESTRLHTAREYNHLPFNRTFPLPYQEFLTKFDIAKGYKEDHFV